MVGLSCTLFVEGGHRYLIEFVINSWEKGSYRVSTESGERVYRDDTGKYHHVLAQPSAADNVLQYATLTYKIYR